LKKQLEGATSTPAPNDEDSGAGGGDDKDAKITALETENADLKAKVKTLEEELEQLKSGNETSTTLADAKARFPKVSFNDAKS
ncbi:hypothetical protein OFC21_33235, partial [Escherichia coli]|nr:hypothetical protein [Escherichia coli]